MSHKEIGGVSPSSNLEERINLSIDRGINYLHDHQLPNGEFLFYMSGDDDMLGHDICTESCVFPAALIGTCLLSLKEHNSMVSDILKKSAAFLFYQMDKGGTWNHYTNLHRFRHLCPQDLDDTACSSYFLNKMDYNIPTTTNQKLMLDNRRKDGLFYTWITFRRILNKNRLYWHYALRELKHPIQSIIFWHKFECTRYDVDAVVNANVLFYLGKRRETKPIVDYLIKIIKENKEQDCDKWYLNPLTVFYFISRNLASGIHELEEIRLILIDKIMSFYHNDTGFGRSHLENALAITSLINLNYKGDEIAKSVSQLIDGQSKNGNWKRWGFYYGGVKQFCFGSEELSTAFSLEALALFKEIHLSSTLKQP
jgi:hypothetical protein